MYGQHVATGVFLATSNRAVQLNCPELHGTLSAHPARLRWASQMCHGKDSSHSSYSSVALPSSWHAHHSHLLPLPGTGLGTQAYPISSWFRDGHVIQMASSDCREDFISCLKERLSFPSHRCEKEVYCPVTADHHLATTGESQLEDTSTWQRERSREEWKIGSEASL